MICENPATVHGLLILTLFEIISVPFFCSKMKSLSRLCMLGTIVPIILFISFKLALLKNSETWIDAVSFTSEVSCLTNPCKTKMSVKDHSNFNMLF